MLSPSEQSRSLSSPSDQVRNSYYIGSDGSLRLLLANGMEVALQTEPHLLAGTVNPTVGKRNVTLPIDNGLNLVEWRQRKEQARGQVTVFGRRLRVSKPRGRSGARVGPLELWRLLGWGGWTWVGGGCHWGVVEKKDERMRTKPESGVLVWETGPRGETFPGPLRKGESQAGTPPTLMGLIMRLIIKSQISLQLLLAE